MQDRCTVRLWFYALASAALIVCGCGDSSEQESPISLDYWDGIGDGIEAGERANQYERRRADQEFLDEQIERQDDPKKGAQAFGGK